MFFSVQSMIAKNCVECALSSFAERTLDVFYIQTVNFSSECAHACAHSPHYVEP